MTNAGVAPFSIVLLFENQANSLQVAPSLRDKGLDVDVVTTASELIKIIASQKIDLVGLSVNHSSASSLVQVLKVRTNVSVLVFGEDQSIATSKAVLKTAGDFQVSGAVSSYNIWMKIGHLVKEKQRAQNKKISPNIHMGRDEESPMMVKSSSKSKLKALQNDERSISVVKSNKNMNDDSGADSDEPTRITAKKQGSKTGANKKKMVMRKPLSSKTKDKHEQSDIAIAENEVSVGPEDLFSDDLQNNTNTSGEDNDESGKILKIGMLSSSKKSSYSVEEDSFSSQEQQLTEEEIIDQEIGEIEQLFFEDQDKKKAAKVSVEIDASGNGSVVTFSEEETRPSYKASADDNDSASEDFSSLEAELMAEQELHKKSVDMEMPDTAEAAKREESEGELLSFKKKNRADEIDAPISEEEEDYSQDESSYETEADKIVSIEAARIKRKQRRDKKAAEQKNSKNKDQEAESAVFRKVFQQAVEKAGESKFTKSEVSKSLGLVTKISIIPVESHKEKGFILVANNENQFSSIDQMVEFKQSLSEEMKKLADVDLGLGEVFNIETQSVDVFAWAEESSQFFSMYENNDMQMIICFLKKDTLLPQIQKVEQYEMHKIEVYALPAKTPLEFDAYLYLERNDKMFPYLRRGGHLTHQQIDRLYNNGFKFLYIKDIAIRDYYAFYLSQYFNQDFQSVKKLA